MDELEQSLYYLRVCCVIVFMFAVLCFPRAKEWKEGGRKVVMVQQKKKRIKSEVQGGDGLKEG